MSEDAAPSNPSAAGGKPSSRRGRASTSTRNPSEDAAAKASLRGPSTDAPKPPSLRGPSTDGPHPVPQSSGQQAAPTLDLSESTTKHSIDRRTLEEVLSPMAPTTPNPFGPRAGSLDLDDYFVGPRDIGKHSKWPFFMRMHGSILPKMILPLIWCGGWASAVTLISKNVKNLGIDSILLTILGFVVGLSLSFRNSTAYERYAEGRRYWTQIILASQNMGRVLWVHSREPDADPEKVKLHLLHSMTCSNLVVAFAVALKHKLRFEPYTAYDDLAHLVSHLHTFAGNATEVAPSGVLLPRKNWFKEVGEYLGVSFAESNPRKALKKAQAPLGNLPLEILNYLGRYVDMLCEEGKIPIPGQQTLAYNNLSFLNDALAHTERVLTTPLPIAYTISISQITWVYVTVLPFQLYNVLDWVTIPATVVAAYIILGLLFIGREIENPFGHDVNDLPLDDYCGQIACEMDVIAAQAMELEDMMSQVEGTKNRVLFPVSSASFKSWKLRGEEKLRDAIRRKPAASFEARWHHEGEGEAKEKEAATTGARKV